MELVAPERDPKQPEDTKVRESRKIQQRGTEAIDCEGNSELAMRNRLIDRSQSRSLPFEGREGESEERKLRVEGGEVNESPRGQCQVGRRLNLIVSRLSALCEVEGKKGRKLREVLPFPPTLHSQQLRRLRDHHTT